MEKNYNEQFIQSAMSTQNIKNFIINKTEIEIGNKIGEGGYGIVLKGKWLGQDVALKQYGKKHRRFKQQKILDFLKEVQLITNLRHPNIVLYMGVCYDSH